MNKRASYPHLPPDPVAQGLIDAIRAYADGESVPKWGKTAAQKALDEAQREMDAVDALDDATVVTKAIAADILLTAEKDLAMERLLGMTHIFPDADRSLDRCVCWAKDVMDVSWRSMTKALAPWQQASLQNRYYRHKGVPRSRSTS